jgi:hypothetical protein
MWNPDPAATPAPGPPWNSDVTTGTALSFAGCSGVLGSPGCLFATEGTLINNGVALTSSTPLPMNTFFQFEVHPNLVWGLSTVFAGSPNTNCQALTTFGTCSVFVGSPIVLELNADGGTTAVLTLGGKASDTGIAGLAGGTNWSGSFTDVIANMTPGQIQLALCPSGTCTSADFTAGRTVTEPDVGGNFFATALTTVPEPNATVPLILMGVAFLIASGWNQRRAEKDGNSIGNRR